MQFRSSQRPALPGGQEELQALVYLVAQLLIAAVQLLPVRVIFGMVFAQVKIGGNRQAKGIRGLEQRLVKGMEESMQVALRE